MNLSVIIPAKGESKNMFACLTSVATTCPDAEIIVVDSGIDNTKEIVLSFQKAHENVRYLHSQPDRGKGDAIAQGIKNCTRDILLQFDADLQFDARDIQALTTPILENKADMTLGSRFLPTSRYNAKKGMRFLGNKIISAWVSFLTEKKVTDSLAGFKAWKKEVTQSFELTSFTYSYEVELLMKAHKKKWRLIDVPISYSERQAGQSTVGVVKAAFQILRDAVHFRFFK